MKLSVNQLQLTLCEAVDCSPPGSSVSEILQARILEWVAMHHSRGSSQLRDRTQISCNTCIVGRIFIAEPPDKSCCSLVGLYCEPWKSHLSFLAGRGNALLGIKKKKKKKILKLEYNFNLNAASQVVILSCGNEKGQKEK